MSAEGLRLAVLGAFAFPHVQGSQVFFGEQLVALRAAGARPVALTYASPGGGPPEAGAWRGIEHRALPARLSPRSARAGPRLAKPVADAALTAALLRAHAEAPFDAVLAHNVEGALVAAAARRWLRCPIVYVAHTLMEQELDSYAPEPARAALRALGRQLDRRAARSADAVIALSEAARATLAEHSAEPERIVHVPPGLERRDVPDEATLRDLSAHCGLEVGSFALYTGNLDGYQDLELLAAAARRTERPVVVATHDAMRMHQVRARLAPLRIIAVPDPAEQRALGFAAGVLVLPRRRVGGFPIKLLNYMEAARPIVAVTRVADGLRDGLDALLLAEEASAADFAAAIERGFALSTAEATTIGCAARTRLERVHAWPAIAERTLAVVADTIRRRNVQSGNRTNEPSGSGSNARTSVTHTGSSAP